MPPDFPRERAGPLEPAPQDQAVATTTDRGKVTTGECRICAHAEKHGSWPPDHRGTHCEGCHRSWTGFREAHCTVCHLHFSSDGVAERHREGYRCLSLSDLTAMRRETGPPVFDLRRRASGLVVVWWRSPQEGLRRFEQLAG